jgi:hypothetical protein
MMCPKADHRVTGTKRWPCLARVSTRDQNLTGQIDALKAAGTARSFNGLANSGKHFPALLCHHYSRHPSGCRLQLWLGATRPIELVIEANDDRVEIGAYADRSNRVEVVVLAAEIVEVIFDLSR